MMGKGAQNSVLLRDPTVPTEAIKLWASGSGTSRTSGKNPVMSPYWIRALNLESPIRLGGMQIREAQLPANTSFEIGETRISIRPEIKDSALPSFPRGARPWMTCTPEGRETLWAARKAAQTSLSVYLGGETGTGKEVLSHLVHAWSQRASGPFIPLNCAALPLNLAESELFGHIRGAYTGAHQHRTGALMQAHNGTLFLDEVGDLPLDIQVKLLRFLENGEIRPVGSDQTSRASVRIICATHKPLAKLVKEGKFRRDLYYRLASISIEIPPLRDRPEDVKLLAQYFSQEMKKCLAPAAVLRLQAHSWPGNVRELRHAVERACGLSDSTSEWLREDAFEFLMKGDGLEDDENSDPVARLSAPVLSLAEMERLMILKALRLSGGNRAKAAKILGVARSTLFEMLKRHKIMGPKATPLELVC